MKSTQTFSILIWANKARTSVKGQSLYARVTVNGKRAEISLKRKVDADRWDAANGRMRGNTMEAKSLNLYLQQVKAELYQIYNHMAARNEFITAEAIKLRYIGEESPQKTILQTIRIHNEEMQRKIGTDVVKATWTKFLTLEKKLTVYIKRYRKKSDFYLEELDYRFVTEFEYFLRSVEKISANTTMKYIRMLKKIMNDAVRKDWLDKNPFNLLANREKSYAFRKLSAPDSAQIYINRFDLVALSDLSTGDGLSYESSWFVLSPADGQWIIRLAFQEDICFMGSGRDSDGNFHDILGIQFEDSEECTNLFFNIEHAASRMFGPEGLKLTAEPDKNEGKKKKPRKRRKANE